MVSKTKPGLYEVALYDSKNEPHLIRAMTFGTVPAGVGDYVSDTPKLSEGDPVYLTTAGKAELASAETGKNAIGVIVAGGGVNKSNQDMLDDNGVTIAGIARIYNNTGTDWTAGKRLTLPTLTTKYHKDLGGIREEGAADATDVYIGVAVSARLGIIFIPPQIGRPYLQSGTVALSGANPGIATVVFTRAFKATPIVVATSRTTAAGVAVRVHTETASQFQLSGTTSESIAWIALGEL